MSERERESVPESNDGPARAVQRERERERGREGERERERGRERERAPQIRPAGKTGPAGSESGPRGPLRLI